MVGVHLDLSSRGVVLAPLVVRLEPELLEPELAQKAIGYGLAVLHRDFLVHDHTTGRVIAHEPGCIFRLFPAKTPVYGEQPYRQLLAVVQIGQRQKPAGGHVAAQRPSGCFGLQAFELRKDIFKDCRDKGIVGIYGVRDLPNQVVALNLALLIAVEDLADRFYFISRKLSIENPVDLGNSVIRDTNIRPRQTSQVETSVQDRQSIRPKLTIDVQSLNHHRVHGFRKAQPEVCLSQLLNCVKDGMRLAVVTATSGVSIVDLRMSEIRAALPPGFVEILTGGLSDLGWIEFHGLDS
ncbi:Uncharacterised protein [uncultured archaeon]|nr:Uncharacterised protein [uncultured archaeon]